MKLSPAAEALHEAIAKAGTQAALAALVGVTQPAVAAWVRAGRVPPWHAIVIEAVIGIPRWRLRPDVWPTAEEAAA